MNVPKIEDGLNWGTLFWKRALDCIIVVLLLPLLLLASAVIACFIKLVSPGPVLFRQTRVGRGGAPFVCFKFRTMKPNASSEGHAKHLAALMSSAAPMTKLDRVGDSRLIPGGAMLRSTGLDELPQLINVIRGEMSVVGPRPCLPYEYSLYSDRHKQRLAAVPGITGLWQVTGKNRTTFEEMIDLDIAYTRQRSLALDLSIISRTTGVLLHQLWETVFYSRPPAMVNPPSPVRDRA